ncbi:alkaline shock response membrane anchor protein AmaP [Enterococcus sp. AZ196]|uniref:alkaline shock response membrane anchor protein AmaP n=1 Tax=Enterococcus sp. AZ196 TaxID=2774659 RepID=UPI003D2C5D51
MNRGIKAIGIIVSIVLITVLLFSILLSSVYPLPFMLERFRFFSVTNNIMQQYIFWAAVVFVAILLIVILVLLFYPKTISTFTLKRGDGQLTLDKSAIEGMVRSYLRDEEFVDSPRVAVRATRNKIKVNIKGKLKRTSSLIGKTGTLMSEIEQKVKQMLGTEEPVKVAVKYTGYQETEHKQYSDDTRVK